MNKQETAPRRQPEGAGQHDARTQLLTPVAMRGQAKTAAAPTQVLPTQAIRENAEANAQHRADEQPSKQNPVKSLFEGLSVSQVAAGALAAVTSMLLSAQIGIAGSVIGVAVGSVVSTVSSQMYKKFLSGSAEKLRGLASSDNDAADAANGATGINGDATRAPFVPNAEQTRIMPPVGNGARPAEYSLAGETRILDQRMLEKPSNAAGAQNAPTIGAIGASPAKTAAASHTPHINSAAGRTGNASHATGIIEAEAEKQRTMQRRVLAVSVASSIIAILLFAGLVSMFTAGKGLGTKVVPFTGETVTSQLAQESDSPEANPTEQAPSAKQQPSQETTTNEQSQTQNANEGSQQSSESTATNLNGQSGSQSGSTTNSGNASSTTGNNASSGTSSDASGSTGTSTGSSSSGSSESGSSSSGANGSSGSTNTGSNHSSSSNGSGNSSSASNGSSN